MVYLVLISTIPVIVATQPKETTLCFLRLLQELMGITENFLNVALSTFHQCLKLRMNASNVGILWQYGHKTGWDGAEKLQSLYQHVKLDPWVAGGGGGGEGLSVRASGWIDAFWNRHSHSCNAGWLSWWILNSIWILALRILDFFQIRAIYTRENKSRVI